MIDACAGADVVWVESPTNPTLDVADLPAIAAAAAAAGARVVADNTFATPICAQPLDDGATVVIHSGTKFIGGHSDLMIGLAVTRDDAVHDRLRHDAARATGRPPVRSKRSSRCAVSAPCPCAWSGHRRTPSRSSTASARTRPSRRSATRVSGRWSHSWFTAAPTLPMRSARPFDLMTQATSLGGVETTLERRQKYAGDAHVAPGLIRMSVGIEHVDDLWDDLEAALGSAASLHS